MMCSCILGIVAFVPYIAQIIKGRCRPHRASWLIWSLMSSVAFGAQLYSGATTSMWFAGGQVIGTLTVFFVSLSYGFGQVLRKRDRCVLALAGVGVVSWCVTDTAAYALIIAISVSALGGIVTIAKTYADPESEAKSKWIVSFFATLCALVSIEQNDWLILAYPIYLITLQTAICLAIFLGSLRTISSPTV